MEHLRLEATAIVLDVISDTLENDLHEDVLHGALPCLGLDSVDVCELCLQINKRLDFLVLLDEVAAMNVELIEQRELWHANTTIRDVLDWVRLRVEEYVFLVTLLQAYPEDATLDAHHRSIQSGTKGSGPPSGTPQLSAAE